MKIAAICSSPRKGNTYSVLNTIKENFPEVDFTILMLKDLNLQLCKGCYNCVLNGEDKCPIKDDLSLLIKDMSDADGVIFASPTYCHSVTAMMKNLFDRMGFIAHRPRFFGKFAMSLSTESGYGAEYAIKYMDKMAAVFGFSVVPSLILDVRPGNVKEEDTQLNTKKAIAAIKILISRIENGTITKPTLGFMVPFHIFKLVSELDPKMCNADYEYYKNKKNYYYDVKINPFKTMIAKKVARKTIFG